MKLLGIIAASLLATLQPIDDGGPRLSLRQLLPCGTALEFPFEAAIPACPKALCVAISAESRVCGCAATDSDEPIRTMFLEVAGEKSLQWSLKVFGIVSEAPFQVYSANLEGDGTDEYLVAVPTGISNGMAVIYYDLIAFSGKSPSRASARISTEDFGTMSYLVSSAPGEPCRLLQTDWRWGSEPKRVAGLYLVGRFMQVQDGSFRPSQELPVIARRYLSSFQELRGRADAPIRWFLHPSTQRVGCPDPLCN